MKFPTLFAASLLVQQAACCQMASTPPSTPNEGAHDAAWNGVDQHASGLLEEQRVPLLYTTTEAWATLEPFPIDAVDAATTGLEKRNAFGPGLSSATKIGLAAGTAGISVASYAVGHSIGKKEGLISGMKGGRNQGGMGMGGGMYKRDDAQTATLQDRALPSAVSVGVATAGVLAGYGAREAVLAHKAKAASVGGGGGGMYKRDDAETALQERALPKGHLTKLIGAGAGAASVGVLAGYGTHKAVTAHRAKAANGGGMGGGEMAPMKRSDGDDDDVDLEKRMKLPKNFGKLAVGGAALAAGGATVGYGGHAAVVRHREQKAAGGMGGAMGGGETAPMKRSDDDDIEFEKRMKLPKNFGKLAVGGAALAAGGAAVGYGGHKAIVRHREQKAAAMGGGGGGGDMGGAPMRRRSVTHAPGGHSLGSARQRSLATRDDGEARLMARDGKASLLTFLKSKPGVGLSVGTVGLGAGYAAGRSHTSSKTAPPPSSDMGGAPM